MYSVIVSLRVKPDMVEQFLEVMGENSRASRRDEPGCLRFDVHRDNDDPNHFASTSSTPTNAPSPRITVNTFATSAFPGDLPEVLS